MNLLIFYSHHIVCRIQFSLKTRNTTENSLSAITRVELEENLNKNAFALK